MNIFGAALCAMLPTVALAQTDGPSANTIRTAMQSVAQIHADCRGGLNMGTGFLFQTSTQIATALHVIAGCSAVKVRFESLPSFRWVPASVDRISSSSDLAILRIQNAIPVPALTLSLISPAAHSRLRAIGFSAEQPTLSELPAEVSVGASRLDEFVDGPKLQELKRANPKLVVSASIIRFNTPLNQGMSGGPIIDDAGNVVAIVAGGLPNLPASVSWGWPSSALSRTTQSDEPPQSVGSMRAQIGYADHEVSTAQKRQCGGLQFFLSGTRTYRDLAPAADDPVHLAVMAKLAMRTQSEIDSLEFDVWRHQSSGATVFVPKGVDLEEATATCVAKSLDGRFLEYVIGLPTDGRQQNDQVSRVFEAGVSAPLGVFQGWDLNITTAGPQGPQTQTQRRDDLIFNRKGAIFLRQTQTRLVASHMFETLLARNGTFVGVAVINDNLTPMPLICLSDRSASECDYIDPWMHFAFAAQLSTYPTY